MIARCPACQQLFPVLGNSRSPCPFCGASLVVLIERLSSTSGVLHPPQAEVAPPAKPVLAWTDRARPFVARFTSTVRAVLKAPAAFFHDLGAPRIKSGLAFMAWVLVPGLLSQALAVFVVLGTNLLPFDAIPRVHLEETGLRLALFAALIVVLFIAYLVTFYQAASAIASGRRPEIRRTILGTCFGFAPMILAVVPVIGLPVGLFWSLAIHTIAMRELHGLGKLQSVLVVIVPLVVMALHFVYA